MVSAVMIFPSNVMFTFFVDNITLIFMYSLGDFSHSTVCCQVLPKLRVQKRFQYKTMKNHHLLLNNRKEINCCSWLEFLGFGASFS